MSSASSGLRTASNSRAALSMSANSAFGGGLTPAAATVSCLSIARAIARATARTTVRALATGGFATALAHTFSLLATPPACRVACGPDLIHPARARACRLSRAWPGTDQASQIRAPQRQRDAGGSRPPYVLVARLGQAGSCVRRMASARTAAPSSPARADARARARSTSPLVTASPRCSAQIHVSATQRAIVAGASAGNSAVSRLVTGSLAVEAVRRTCCAPVTARCITACILDLCKRVSACLGHAALPQSHSSPLDRTVKSR